MLRMNGQGLDGPYFEAGAPVPWRFADMERTNGFLVAIILGEEMGRKRDGRPSIPPALEIRSHLRALAFYMEPQKNAVVPKNWTV